MKSEANKAKRNPGRLKRLVRLRPVVAIANELAEDMPVSKAELVKLVKSEQKDNQRLQNSVNRLRDACVKIGLMLTLPSKTKHECLVEIMAALKQPNDQAQRPAGKEQ